MAKKLPVLKGGQDLGSLHMVSGQPTDHDIVKLSLNQKQLVWRRPWRWEGEGASRTISIDQFNLDLFSEDGVYRYNLNYHYHKNVAYFHGFFQVTVLTIKLFAKENSILRVITHVMDWECGGGNYSVVHNFPIADGTPTPKYVYENVIAAELELPVHVRIGKCGPSPKKSSSSKPKGSASASKRAKKKR